MKIIEITEGTRCWKGYERKGFKIHPFSKNITGGMSEWDKIKD